MMSPTSYYGADTPVNRIVPVLTAGPRRFSPQRQDPGRHKSVHIEEQRGSLRESLTSDTYNLDDYYRSSTMSNGSRASQRAALKRMAESPVPDVTQPLNVRRNVPPPINMHAVRERYPERPLPPLPTRSSYGSRRSQRVDSRYPWNPDLETKRLSDNLEEVNLREYPVPRKLDSPLSPNSEYNAANIRRSQASDGGGFVASLANEARRRSQAVMSRFTNRSSTLSQKAMNGIPIAPISPKYVGEEHLATLAARRKKKKVRIWIIAGAVGLLILIAIVVGVVASKKANKEDSTTPAAVAGSNVTMNAGSATGTNPTAVAAADPGVTSASTTSTTSTTPTATVIKDCAAAFEAGKPSGYSCSSCVPVMSTVDNDFASDTAPSANGSGAQLQYCAALDILDQSSVPDDLHNGGWGEDMAPCGLSGGGAWDGIVCDDWGRVVSLELADVLDSVPSSLGNLPALQALYIEGNGKAPKGEFPLDAFGSLSSLVQVQISNTALEGEFGGLDASGLTKLTSMLLFNNTLLGTSVPNLSASTSLGLLAVSGQGLKSFDAAVLPDSITIVDISNNELTGRVPDFSNLPKLVSLYLDKNSFTEAPESLPTTLCALRLDNNPDLSGTVPQAFCTADKTPATCNMKNTSLVLPSDTHCGVCLL
jgi:hypothetical protein